MNATEVKKAMLRRIKSLHQTMLSLSIDTHRPVVERRVTAVGVTCGLITIVAICRELGIKDVAQIADEGAESLSLFVEEGRPEYATDRFTNATRRMKHVEDLILACRETPEETLDGLAAMRRRWEAKVQNNTKQRA
jgi:hypothetical protein